MIFSDMWAHHIEQILLFIPLTLLLILRPFLSRKPIFLKTFFYLSVCSYLLLCMHSKHHLIAQKAVLIFFLIAFLIFYFCMGQILYHKSSDTESMFFKLLWLFGLYLMLYANHWVLLYISFELVSLPFYVWPLTASHPDRYRGVSRYFLTQIVLNAFWILSVSYAQVTHSDCFSFFDFFAYQDISVNLLICTTMIMIFTKMGVYPMGYWVADLYTVMTREHIFWFGFVPKFYVLCFFSRFIEAAHLRESALICLSVLILAGSFWGHFLATYEKNLQRFLGFTSIAQNGFLLIPICFMGSLGLMYSLFYLVIYSVGVLLVLYGVQRSFIEDIGDLFGRSLSKAPLFSYSIGLFSLAGFPPTPGFFAKIWILIALFAYSGVSRWLGLVLLLSSILGLYYYMNWLLLLPRYAISQLDEHQAVETDPH